MKQRTKGEILSTVGFPFQFSFMSLINSLADEDLLRFLWSVPLTIITLPLAPLAMKGHEILFNYNQEEFEKATAHLPKVSDVSNALYIENDDEHWYVNPPYYMGQVDEFSSEEEARQWLYSKGYNEVVLDKPGYATHITGTYWIK